MPGEELMLHLDDAIRRYQSGESMRSISRDLGLQRRELSAVLIERGLREKRVYPPLDTDEIVRLYAAGHSCRVVARMLGTNFEAVRRTAMQAGILRDNAAASALEARRRTPEQRRQYTEAAHAAVRGRPISEESRRKAARTREERGLGVSRLEEICTEMLESFGFSATPQKAIGCYNVDLALHEAPVAVEIFGGNWHANGRHAARFRKRTDYLLDAGYYPVCIWVSHRQPLEVGAIAKVVSLAERLCRGESVPRQELMIRGDGEATTAGQSHFDD